MLNMELKYGVFYDEREVLNVRFYKTWKGGFQSDYYLFYPQFLRIKLVLIQQTKLQETCFLFVYVKFIFFWMKINLKKMICALQFTSATILGQHIRSGETTPIFGRRVQYSNKFDDNFICWLRLRKDANVEALLYLQASLKIEKGEDRITLYLFTGIAIASLERLQITFLFDKRIENGRNNRKYIGHSAPFSPNHYKNRRCKNG